VEYRKEALHPHSICLNSMLTRFPATLDGSSAIITTVIVNGTASGSLNGLGFVNQPFSFLGRYVFNASYPGSALWHLLLIASRALQLEAKKLSLFVVPDFPAKAQTTLVFDGEQEKMFTELMVIEINQSYRADSSFVARIVNGAAFERLKTSAGMLILDRRLFRPTLLTQILDMPRNVVTPGAHASVRVPLR
jgi:hypothetical protein